MSDGWRRCDAESLAVVTKCITDADRESVRRLAPIAAAELRKQPVLAAAALRLAPADGIWWPIGLLTAAASPDDKKPLSHLLSVAAAHMWLNHECDTVA